MRVFRINVVNREGRVVVLGTADRARKALYDLQNALGDYTRAWVTDEQEMDVGLTELMRLADEEENL